MAISRLSDFASTSTTANNAERFGSWTLAGGGDRITLEAVDLSGTATAADIRVYVGGRRLHVVESAAQQTTRGVVALELLKHELPAAGARQVVVYWPSATRIHVTAVEWSGTRQRPTPSADVFFATSASAQNANLTGTAPTNGGALHMMAWFAGTSSWTLGSGQTKVGADNQQTTFLSVGGYETGLSSGSQASDCSVAAAAAAIGQICMFLAEDAQDLVALDPADGATSVSTSPTLEVELSATVVQGTGSLRVYETAAPSASPTVDDAATSSNSTNASPFTVSIPTTSAGKRLLVVVVSDGSRYSAGVITDTGSPSPWHGIYRGAGFLVCYRECDGSEPSTYDFATVPAEGCVARAYLISGHDQDTPPEIAFTIGDSSTVDPPSVAFSWGTEPTLVFAFAGTDNGSTVSGANYPSGYTGTGTQASTQATTGDRAGLGWCYKSGVTAGSENPGTFTLTAGEGWNGITVAIRPADPSVLADTIDVADATLAGATAQFDASGLAASTAHHAVLDAGAIVDFEGIRGPTAWNFTTGVGGGLDEIELGGEAYGEGQVTGAAGSAITLGGALMGAGRVTGFLEPRITAGGEAHAGGRVAGEGTPIASGEGSALGAGLGSGAVIPLVTATGSARGLGQATGVGVPLIVATGGSLGAGRVSIAAYPSITAGGEAHGQGRVQSAAPANELGGEARGGGYVMGSVTPTAGLAGTARGGGATASAAVTARSVAAGIARGVGRALGAVLSAIGLGGEARAAGRVAGRVGEIATYAPGPPERTRIAMSRALRSRVSYPRGNVRAAGFRARRLK